MLSWSGKQTNVAVNIDTIATGLGDGGLPFGQELVQFASAIAGFDDDALQLARNRLVAAAGYPAMVDAAAVAANFEMMTRVANGTGAAFDGNTLAARSAMGDRLGVRTETP